MTAISTYRKFEVFTALSDVYIVQIFVNNMKYIFRYALLTNFTTKQNQITPEQLGEALKLAKFNLAGRNIEDLVSQANVCIEMLLRNNDKKDVESIVAEAYQRQGLSEGEQAEIVAVW